MCNSDTSVWQNFLYAWNLINLILSYWLPISCTKNQWNSDTCWKCLSYYSTSWTLPSQVILSFPSFGLVNEAIERRAEQTSKWHAHWTQRLLLPVVPTSICWAFQSVKHTQLLYAWSYINSVKDYFEPCHPRVLPKVSVCIVDNNDLGQLFLRPREVTISVITVNDQAG